MANLGRLKWCVVALTAALWAHAHADPGAGQLRLGVQLWSVRDQVELDIDDSLAQLAALGVQGVEFAAGRFGRYANSPSALRLVLAKNGLACIGAHVRLDALTAATFASTTSFYQALGCTTLIIARDARAKTIDGAAEVAGDLASLAAKLKGVGMQLGYHNHAEEMHGADGATPWDVIARGTPATVLLEQDVGWTTFAKKDPAALVARYPGRSIYLHMKSKSPDGAAGISIIGQDRTDWRAVLTAARTVGGTQWLVVELDEPPAGMGAMEGVAASLRGLQAILVRPPDIR